MQPYNLVTVFMKDQNSNGPAAYNCNTSTSALLSLEVLETTITTRQMC
jgi:hypothetical protein